MTSARKVGIRTISPEAIQEIEDRIADARPWVLQDLALICFDRSGALTLPQVDACAAVLSHLCPEGTDLLSEFKEWLQENQADPNLADIWAQRDVGKRVLLAHGAGMTVRRDLATGALRMMFGADRDAERLSLRQLVPERLRSRARRRQEGVAPRKPAQGEPWAAAGVSRATWFRQQRAARSADETGTTVSKRDKKIVAPLRSLESQFPSDHETYFLPDGFPVLPTQPLRPEAPWRPPAVADLPSAEGRRYATNALAAGARWTGDDRFDPAVPGSWFDLPNDLPEVVRSVILLAQNVAERAIVRRERIAASRFRREPPPPPRDPYTRPKLVSPEVWDAVPVELRPICLGHAAVFWVGGFSPDYAARIGAEAARRQVVRAAAIHAALPDAPADEIDWEARRRWWQPFDEAVSEGVATLREWLRSPLDGLSDDLIAQAKRVLAEKGDFQDHDRLDPETLADYRIWWLAALARAIVKGDPREGRELIEAAQKEGATARNYRTRRWVPPPPRARSADQVNPEGFW